MLTELGRREHAQDAKFAPRPTFIDGCVAKGPSGRHVLIGAMHAHAGPWAWHMAHGARRSFGGAIRLPWESGRRFLWAMGTMNGNQGVSSLAFIG